MKNMVGSWYSSQDPLWWLSFAEEDEQKPWWKFWRSSKEGEFLGVVIVQAPDIHEAVQVAWRKNINPGGEVFGVQILNADLDDLNRLIDAPEAQEIADRTKVLDVENSVMQKILARAEAIDMSQCRREDLLDLLPIRRCKILKGTRTNG